METMELLNKVKYIVKYVYEEDRMEEVISMAQDVKEFFGFDRLEDWGVEDGCLYIGSEDFCICPGN